MDTAQSKDGDSGGAKCWFVRNEQGRRFGPTDFVTLQGWARDGRIGPLNEVSCDGMRWSLACSMPEMEMDWVAALAPGNYYGPIHAGALRELLADGSINADAALFRRERLDAGIRHDAAAELAGLRELTEKLQSLEAERKAEAESLRALAAELKAEAESLRALAAERKAEAESLRALAAGHKAEAESLRALAAGHKAEAESLRGRLKETEEQAREQRRLDAARTAAIEDELGKTRRELSEAVSRSGRLQSDAENLARLRAEERGAYDKRELAAREEARRAVAREAELSARVTALEEDLATSRKQAAAVGAASEASAAEEAELLPPDTGARKRTGGFAHKTAYGSGARPAAGLSMAALEAQARRELEMLGSGARMFFSKDRK